MTRYQTHAGTVKGRGSQLAAKDLIDYFTVFYCIFCCICVSVSKTLHVLNWYKTRSLVAFYGVIMLYKIIILCCDSKSLFWRVKKCIYSPIGKFIYVIISFVWWKCLNV